MKTVSSILVIVFMLTSWHAFAENTPQKNGKVEIIPPSTRDMQQVIYSQMSPIANSVASQVFPDFGSSYMQGADDFVVPAGDVWRLEFIEVYGGYFNGPGPVPLFNIYIYGDNSGIPGAEIYKMEGISYGVSGSIFSFVLPEPKVLFEGTYWLSIVAVMDFVPLGQWGWTMHTNIPAPVWSEFQWRDPDMLATSFNSWTPATTVFPGLETDLTFALYGAGGSQVPVAGWVIALVGALIAGTVFIRYRKTYQKSTS
jgi:hypothetical protein